jgi:hypothetical protein
MSALQPLQGSCGQSGRAAVSIQNFGASTPLRTGDVGLSKRDPRHLLLSRCVVRRRRRLDFEIASAYFLRNRK